MQKFSLLSYQFWYNYGTCLQAYALWKFLEKNGYASEYLNFDWRYPVELSVHYDNFWRYKIPNHRLFNEVKYRIRVYLRAIKHHRLLKQLFNDYICYTNSRHFDMFHKEYIKESEPIADEALKLVEKNYSKFIIGSDQVWNPDCCEQKYFKHFLLDFVRNSEKKLSYAPSIGKTDVDEIAKGLFKQYLGDFNSVCCREKTGCEILKEVLDKNVERIIDPTFLLYPEDWSRIAKKKRKVHNAVVCYVLGSRESIVDFAEVIANENNKQLIVITSTPSLVLKYHKYVLPGIGPREFIGLLFDCSCIVTDSYHGTAFSINFNKPFYSFMKHEGNRNLSDNHRIIDLLHQFHLEDRFRDDSNKTYSIDISYDEANRILKIERKKATRYLLKMINS